MTDQVRITRSNVAVGSDIFWNEDMSACPRSKVFLLTQDNLAMVDEYKGQAHYKKWYPVPGNQENHSMNHPIPDNMRGYPKPSFPNHPTRPPATPPRVPSGIEVLELDTETPTLIKAPELLNAALQHMLDRAKTYDKPEGERSAAAVAETFNAITRRTGKAALTESDAWLVLVCLKLVRDRSGASPHVDSLEDSISYAALHAESRLRELQA